MDESHRMDAGRKLGGTPDVAEGLLVETIWLIVNQHRHCPEIPSTLIAQIETLPCKTKGYFISNAIGDMQGAFIGELRPGIHLKRPEPIISNIGICIIIFSG